MPRVANEHGACDAPEGWIELTGLGARAPGSPEGEAVRASLVLTGDTRAAGVSMRAYIDAQQAALADLLAGWRPIDEATPEVEPGPAVLRYCFQPPDDPWVVQFQAYWFFGERVAIVTVTAPASEANEAWATFSQAISSYAAPSPSAAVRRP